MNYIPYVNTKMGTKSVMRYSNGNTLPLTQLPFGMISFSPQSDGSTSWFFTPDYPYIEGVRLTHQPSPWIDDYGTVLLMPQSDIISDTPSGAWSGYRISDAVMRPDYLKIKMLRSACTLELTPTERACVLRLNFEDERQAYLSCLPTCGSYEYELDESTATLFGTTDGHSKDDSRDFKMYFVIRFDKSSIICEKSYAGKNCYHIALNGKSVEARVAISYISHEMALLSLDRECGKRQFDDILAEAGASWEERLGKIEIDADESTKRTFYSCMYRAHLFPHKAYEIDAQGRSVHYSPTLAEIREGVRYTDNGFWDTYRTVYPLFSLIAREDFSEMMRGFVNDYLESGWLPRWTSLGEVGCMPSTLIDAVIAEGAAEGLIPNELLRIAFEGMIKHASIPSDKKIYGRNGIAEYIKYGYVPRDKYGESVNLTLDFAYGDWCIAQVAKRLGKENIYTEYMKRSENYKHLFDKETGFMRGRDVNGKMAKDFDPFKWGGEYTEASAWQSTLAVCHDIDGLCDLFGGKQELISYLDRLFGEKPDYRVHGYGGEIHEMTEMASVDFGQCAISNQPSFHIPYLYAQLGEKSKSEYWVERICKELFSATENGYPGDEDNGTMSAWYILSCLGMYRLCPGNGEWIKIKPLVRSAKILGKQIF